MFTDTNRQLRKLSIYKPMQFRVTEIDFDFDSDSFDEEVMDTEDRQEIIDEVLATTWQASNADDLVEEMVQQDLNKLN